MPIPNVARQAAAVKRLWWYGQVREDLDVWERDLPYYAFLLLGRVDKLEGRDPKRFCVGAGQDPVTCVLWVLAVPASSRRAARRAVQQLFEAGALQVLDGQIRGVSPQGWVRTADGIGPWEGVDAVQFARPLEGREEGRNAPVCEASADPPRILPGSSPDQGRIINRSQVREILGPTSMEPAPIRLDQLNQREEAAAGPPRSASVDTRARAEAPPADPLPDRPPARPSPSPAAAAAATPPDTKKGEHPLKAPRSERDRPAATPTHARVNGHTYTATRGGEPTPLADLVGALRTPPAAPLAEPATGPLADDPPPPPQSADPEPADPEAPEAPAEPETPAAPAPRSERDRPAATPSNPGIHGSPLSSRLCNGCSEPFKSETTSAELGALLEQFLARCPGRGPGGDPAPEAPDPDPGPETAPESAAAAPAQVPGRPEPVPAPTGRPGVSGEDREPWCRRTACHAYQRHWFAATGKHRAYETLDREALEAWGRLIGAQARAEQGDPYVLAELHLRWFFAQPWAQNRGYDARRLVPDFAGDLEKARRFRPPSAPRTREFRRDRRAPPERTHDESEAAYGARMKEFIERNDALRDQGEWYWDMRRNCLAPPPRCTPARST